MTFLGSWEPFLFPCQCKLQPLCSTRENSFLDTNIVLLYSFILDANTILRATHCCIWDKFWLTHQRFSEYSLKLHLSAEGFLGPMTCTNHKTPSNSVLMMHTSSTILTILCSLNRGLAGWHSLYKIAVTVHSMTAIWAHNTLGVLEKDAGICLYGNYKAVNNKCPWECFRSIGWSRASLF